MLEDYGISQDTMTISCDNTSVIHICHNPFQHLRTKHIRIHEHFIRQLVEEKVVSLSFVPTNRQLADIFMKPLDALRFESLRKSLGIYTVD